MEKQSKKEKMAEYKERKVTGGIYAIKNSVTGKLLLLSTCDLQGSQNRFLFSQKTGSCINIKLQDDYSKYGADAFVFEVLEDLEKKETQTAKEFTEDMKILLELWTEKLKDSMLY
jgi:hypothetical protein